jgi:hypothetical protein
VRSWVSQERKSPRVIDTEHPPHKGGSKLAFRVRAVLIGSAASIPITHCMPFNQQRLLALGCYLFGRLGHMHDFAHDLYDRVAVGARCA